MTQTPEYLAIRKALISARERFQEMVLAANKGKDVAWYYGEAIKGFRETDAILSDGKNQEN
jgi:hypothetical protein